MKKTDVKKTERSKEFLAEEWLEIVLKGQDKGEGRFCRYGMCSFMGRQPLTFWPVKRKPGIGKAIYGESNHGESNHGKSNYGKSNHEKIGSGDTEQLVRTGRSGQ